MDIFLEQHILTTTENFHIILILRSLRGGTQFYEFGIEYNNRITLFALLLSYTNYRK